MHVYARDVNDAFRKLVALFDGEEYAVTDCPVAPPVKKSSRNGPVMMLEEPFTITYERPTERVLFNTARDANPFFHLYHSLWLLAGRDDIAAPAYYVKRYADYSDNGVTANGSYGRRWRRAFNSNMTADQPAFVDQLDLLVAHLKTNPTSRRAVLQMWNVEDDLLKVNSSKDVCCNLSVVFSVRTVDGDLHPNEGDGRDPATFNALDMTVLNRSNDMIWGMLGEDFATFSVLQEYTAARLGAKVGRYHHVSNNLHVYESNWKPKEWLTGGSPKVGDRRVPLMKDPVAFDEQLPKIVSYFDGSGRDGKLTAADVTEPFLWDVARPTLTAFARHKRGKTEDALRICDEIEADDWRAVATQWLQRRQK